MELIPKENDKIICVKVGKVMRKNTIGTGTLSRI